MATTYTRRTYSESDRTKNARKTLDDHQAAKPADYESDWMAQLDEAVNRILSREAFQYDPSTDPLYQQYRDSYLNQGRMAMMDTMGQAAALTGGYGNSYAQLAGQQAYQGYMQNLNDVIPELYQLALDTYDRRGQQLYDQYGVLYDREGLDYSRYQDALANWNDERDYLAGRYDAERGFDYSEYRDLVGDDQWQAEFDEDLRRYEYEHMLGEFAPVATYSDAGDSSTATYRKTTNTEDEEDKEKKKTASSAGNHIIIPSRTSPMLRTDESY